MTGMHDDTQLAIVRHLRQQGDSTLAEVSRGLGKTTVTIRHHLSRLEADGAVVATSRHHARGPGRPEKVYKLTPRAVPLLPDNYQEIACQLVGHMLHTLAQADAAQLLSGSALQLAAELSQGWADDGASRRRRTLEALEARGYFPTWQDAGGDRCLRLRHCPYAVAAARAPGLCVFDVSLLGALLGTEVSLEQSIAQGDSVCEFSLSVDRLPSFRIK